MANFGLSDINNPYNNDYNSGLSNYYSGFDARGYMDANPDVKKAILRGETFGAKANTSSNPMYGNQGGYWIGGANNILLNDPLKAAAVSHYQQFGMNEGRTGGGVNFGGAYNYNPSGTSGTSGENERRGSFDENFYLSKNPDVAKAVLNGSMKSGYDHWLQYGQNEDRTWRTKGSDGSIGVTNWSNADKAANSSGSSGTSGGSGSSGSSGSSGNSTTTTNDSLFGTGGYLGTGVNFDDYVEKMKGLTDWKLGIDKRSMENAYGFRNQEATRDYGFQTGLAGQQIQGQKDIQGQQIEGTKNLETLRNEYMNKRQTEQLANQRAMQEAGFSQQSKLLTDNAARAKSLYFGSGSTR